MTITPLRLDYRTGNMPFLRTYTLNQAGVYGAIQTGDLIVVQAHARIFGGGSDSITVTGTWDGHIGPLTLLPVGSVRRYHLWYRRATSADVGVPITVTWGAGFHTGDPNVWASLDVVRGGVAVFGPSVTSTPVGAGTWTLDAAQPTRSALGVIYGAIQTSFATGGANGWSRIDSSNLPVFSLPTQPPPHADPVLNQTTDGQAAIAFSVTDIPERHGWRLGALGFGPRSSGF